MTLGKTTQDGPKCYNNLESIEMIRSIVDVIVVGKCL
jgi:hypothetical protein